jgi:hypothetical protein
MDETHRDLLGDFHELLLPTVCGETSMAKTPAEILALQKEFAERSSRAFESTRHRDASLAAMNLGHALDSFLMEGLIRWRCGIGSPVDPFKKGIAFFRQGLDKLQLATIAPAIRERNLPLEKASFMSFLVGETMFAPTAITLAADRLLDVLLVLGLSDAWDDAAWETGVGQLKKLKGTALAIETYSNYRHLLRHANDGDIESAVATGTNLFQKRKSNGFYSGGVSTCGGGPDNDIAVDYELAAIMKKVGCRSESIHQWRWE